MACNDIAAKTTLCNDNEVVALCGIAQPDYFIRQAEKSFNICRKLIFGDHHDFGKNDIEKMKEACRDRKIIVTTEKDAMRLTNNRYFSTLKDIPVFYIPVEVRFEEYEASRFNKEILD